MTFKSYKEEPLRDFADKIRQNMSNDARFTSLKTYVEEMAKRLDAYRTIALDSNAGGKIYTIQKNAKKEELLYQLVLLAKHVDLLANEKEEVVIASGYELRTTAASRPTSFLASPMIQKISKGDRSGSVYIEWPHVEGVLYYSIERRIAAEGEWMNGDSTAAKSITLYGFELGQKMEFRICTVGRNNQKSDYSTAIDIYIS